MYYMCVALFLGESEGEGEGALCCIFGRECEREGGGGCRSVHTCRCLIIVYIGPLDTCLDILV